MNRALSADAVGYYLNLGPARSYDAVALHFKVSKRTVTSTAAREHWQTKLKEYDRKAREQIGERYVQSIAEANERHVKLGKFLQSIGITAIQSTPVVGAGAGLRAVKVGVEIERLGLGEATQRIETSEADAVRTAFAQCMVGNDDEDVDAPADDEPAEAPEADDEDA